MRHGIFNRGFKKAIAAAVIGVGLGAAFSAASSPASASVCATPEETRAMQVRLLQNRLMVSALTCEAIPHYNAFINRFQSTLSSSGNTMQGYFRRAHGSGGQSRLTTHMTSHANQISLEGLGNRAAFCANTMRILDAVSSLSDQELYTFTASLEDDGLLVPGTCRADTQHAQR